MMNLSAVEAATPEVLARGIKVFNGALFGADEREHVDVLLEVLDPPANAMLIDAGCGVGEMARLMCERRPDLDFLLVNLSAAQLELCPPTFHRMVADFDNLAGVPDGSADAIIFSFAICHSPDWSKTLAEARRVLKTGGTLLVNDMARLAGENERFEEVLGARAHEPEAIEAWARAAGFRLDVAIAPGVQVDRMAELLAADGIDGSLMVDVIPTIWRFTALSPADAVWARHEGRIAFQFSGGRDSTAALYLLRDRWPQMAIYHLDTGDQFPETRAVVAQVEADLLRAGVVLRRIASDVQQVRETHGYPVDLVPVDNTDFGRLVSGAALHLTGRYECCARALMAPMHARMVEDGITLIVRGQRDDEYATPPLRSGAKAEGFEFLYPVQSWNSAKVDVFLQSEQLPVAAFYAAGTRRAPECMGCTAWWDEGRARYMRQHHPEQHRVVMHRMADIKKAIGTQLAWLNSELEA